MFELVSRFTASPRLWHCWSIRAPALCGRVRDSVRQARAHSPHRHSRSQEHFRCVRISFDSFTRLVPHLQLKVFSPSLNDPDSRARFDGDFFRTCQVPPLLNDAPENIRGQKPVVFRRRDGAIWTDLCCFASCLGLRSVTARQNRNADSATSFAAPNC